MGLQPVSAIPQCPQQCTDESRYPAAGWLAFITLPNVSHWGHKCSFYRTRAGCGCSPFHRRLLPRLVWVLVLVLRVNMGWWLSVCVCVGPRCLWWWCRGGAGAAAAGVLASDYLCVLWRTLHWSLWRDRKQQMQSSIKKSLRRMSPSLHWQWQIPVWWLMCGALTLARGGTPLYWGRSRGAWGWPLMWRWGSDVLSRGRNLWAVVVLVWGTCKWEEEEMTACQRHNFRHMWQTIDKAELKSNKY